MSRIWVTRVHGSAKVVVRIGLVQQRTMLTDPSYFFCVWFLVPLPLSSFFATRSVLVNSAYRTNTIMTTAMFS